MNEFECKKCGYIWYSRFEEGPKACPRCKRYDWDKETTQNLNNKEGTE